MGGAGGAEGRVIGVGGGGGNSYAAATGLMEEQLQTYCVNPVEVKVSNLDYNISGGEWKKILYSEFNQHILVSNAVSWHSTVIDTMTVTRS